MLHRGTVELGGMAHLPIANRAEIGPTTLPETAFPAPATIEDNKMARESFTHTKMSKKAPSERLIVRMRRNPKHPWARAHDIVKGSTGCPHLPMTTGNEEGKGEYRHQAQARRAGNAQSSTATAERCHVQQRCDSGQFARQIWQDLEKTRWHRDETQTNIILGGCVPFEGNQPRHLNNHRRYRFVRQCHVELKPLPNLAGVVAVNAHATHTDVGDWQRGETKPRRTCINGDVDAPEPSTIFRARVRLWWALKTLHQPLQHTAHSPSAHAATVARARSASFQMPDGLSRAADYKNLGRFAKGAAGPGGIFE